MLSDEYVRQVLAMLDALNQFKRLLDIHYMITRGVLKYYKIFLGQHIGLRRASSDMLSSYIKEIDVLTPEKLRTIRKVRQLLNM